MRFSVGSLLLATTATVSMMDEIGMHTHLEKLFVFWETSWESTNDSEGWNIEKPTRNHQVQLPSTSEMLRYLSIYKNFNG